MSELTLITEDFKVNQCYTIESAAINKSDLIVVMKESEVDDFLKNFIQGKTSYKIAINTDSVEIRLKHCVYTRSFLHGSNGNNELISFIINLLPSN